jgi:hypothetical protein
LAIGSVAVMEMPLAAIARLDNTSAFNNGWLHAVGVGVTVVGVVVTVVRSIRDGELVANRGRQRQANHSCHRRCVLAGAQPDFTSMLVTSFGLVMMIPNV